MQQTFNNTFKVMSINFEPFDSKLKGITNVSSISKRGDLFFTTIKGLGSPISTPRHPTAPIIRKLPQEIDFYWTLLELPG